MNQRYTILLCCIISCFFFNSCVERERQIEQQMKDLKVNVLCNPVNTSFPIGIPIQMLRVDDYIIFNDFNTDPMLTIYDTKKDTVVSQFLYVGRGEGELLPPVELYLIRDSLYIHDRNSNVLYSVLWEEVVLGNNIKLSKKLQLPSEVSALTTFGQDQFIASGTFRDGRFAIINELGKNSRVFGEYPDLISEEVNFPNEGKFMFHQSFFLDHHKTNKKLVYTSHTLEIYDCQDSLLTNGCKILLSPYSYVCKNGDMLGVDVSPETKRGVVYAQCSDKYIYLLFSHNQRSSTDEQTEIWVFDWNGKPVKCLSPDKKILSFSVDDDDEVIYAVDSNSELNIITI